MDRRGPAEGHHGAVRRGRRSRGLTGATIVCLTFAALLLLAGEIVAAVIFGLTAVLAHLAWWSGERAADRTIEAVTRHEQHWELLPPHLARRKARWERKQAGGRPPGAGSSPGG